ncbi:S-methyl-5-thioribose-1-phosphate isomerase [Epidermidibacterium keratini]|uniref:S-methyl-5-thioribose-1-phosphate isomerase n=1 Tax=Epidermidibacterium keratini TaxID=1891644 RepID=UPI00384F647D
MRPIDWVSDDSADSEAAGPGHIRLLDQTALPTAEKVLEIRTVDDLVDAISRLAVRGAPALGVAGALGVALAAYSLPADDVPAAAQKVRDARPTAVNLAWAVDQAVAALPQGPDAVLALARQIRDDDIASSQAIARRGADELYTTLGPDAQRDGLGLMTICNTGSLAAVERGTALAVIEEVLHDGHLQRAYPLETRPLLQGSRLTAWELQQMGAPFDLLVDSAAASTMRRGIVDAVLTGADRIAANGDTANKIGTLALAIAAKYAGIPFYIVAPESTIDVQTATGEDIEIEDRGSAEVTAIQGVQTAPQSTTALNPAFDVTPAELITGIITDRRVIHPAAGERPDDALESPNHRGEPAEAAEAVHEGAKT